MGASESFMTPARAFLGDFGRAGVGSETVGVMQITGRCVLIQNNSPTVACPKFTCEETRTHEDCAGTGSGDGAAFYNGNGLGLRS
jgi:hypothetical protein